MENSKMSAFPIHATEQSASNQQPLMPQEGLTKREYFAAKAPKEIPDWFEYIPTEKPTLPKSWVDLPDSDEDKKQLKDWTHDGCYDLPNHLQWYQQSHEEYNTSLAEWKILNEKQKYFQWIVFFADELLKQLSAPQPPIKKEE